MSTYSTLCFETVGLVETGAKMLAAANMAVSITAGLVAAFLGTSLADTLLH
ncbi:hypothetical protein [Kitasatospora sp. NPDC088346]|uniref:hypothetical protein n=1 Tax=Kitasatospora sp. NPDC088346 TaxID=3364073 RepID=UPI0037FF8C40